MEVGWHQLLIARHAVRGKYHKCGPGQKDKLCNNKEKATKLGVKEKIGGWRPSSVQSAKNILHWRAVNKKQTAATARSLQLQTLVPKKLKIRRAQKMQKTRTKMSKRKNWEIFYHFKGHCGTKRVSSNVKSGFPDTTPPNQRNVKACKLLNTLELSISWLRFCSDQITTKSAS